MQEHIDDRRAREFLAAKLGRDVPDAVYRRIVASIGCPPWSRDEESLAVAMAREALGGERHAGAVVQEALERRQPLLTSLIAPHGEAWRKALEEAEARMARSPIEAIRMHLFGYPTPPLSPSCTWRDVVGLLERLSGHPRKAGPWQVFFDVLPGLPVGLLLGSLARLRFGDRTFEGEQVAGTALGELLELVRGLSLFMGVSPYELLDYILTGEPPYGLPWLELKEGGTVLAGGTPQAVEKLLEVMGKRGQVPAQVFEAFLQETRGRRWQERLQDWNARYGPRLGRQFHTVSALRKAVWTARRRGWG